MWNSVASVQLTEINQLQTSDILAKHFFYKGTSTSETLEVINILV